MATSDAAPARRSPRILVVDDDESVREMIARVLVNDGYSAWPAAEGAEAQAIAATAPIDLALLDLGLQGVDGWETFHSLRRQNPRLPVIIITATPNQRGVAAACGAGALFEKPLDFPELLRAVRRILSEPSQPRGYLDAAAQRPARSR